MKQKLWQLIFAVSGIVAIALLAAAVLAAGEGPSDKQDWAPVEHALGHKGELLPGGVFKVPLTRGEPPIMVDGVRLSPAMVYDSWISFVRMGNGAMMMGDIVLTPDEMGPVQRRLMEEGIDITAVHNTLIGETPQVYDLHISARGDPAEIARNVRDAISLTGTAFTGNGVESHNVATLDTGRLDDIIGANGAMEGGVYQFNIPRAETIMMDSMAIPPTMDVATAIKFQSLGNGTAAITGDLILRPEEVKPVFKTLSENGIVVTALHTHMLTESPRLFMMHFWAAGDAERLAHGLRLALDDTNSL